MSITDTHYLRLQFWEKIFRKNGTEFQSFFEDLMQCLYDDFRKIKAYGNIGDRKNDGFRDGVGIYYQVYAPEQAADKQQEAVSKFLGDFDGLYEHWNETTPIKEFYFVFNDKDLGLSPLFFTEALNQLRAKHAGIKFDILTPKQLEKEFFKLSEDDKAYLGFSVDKTKIIGLIEDILADIDIDLDRGCCKSALKSLRNIEKSIAGLGNESVSIKHGLKTAAALRDSGHIEDAESQYKSLCALHPENPDPILGLAELELLRKNHDRNLALLTQAQGFGADVELLKIHRLVRAINLNESIDVANLDENDFPEDMRKRSTFYRLYSIAYYQSGNFSIAKQFLEKAISFNPNKLGSYQLKMTYQINHLARQTFSNVSKESVSQVMNELNSILVMYASWETDSLRDRIPLLMHKFILLHPLGEIKEAEKLAEEIIELCLQCPYLDVSENAFCKLLVGNFSDENFSRVLAYLESDEYSLSDELTKKLIFQFTHRNELISRGKPFFMRKGMSDVVSYIESVERNDVSGMLKYIKTDFLFAREFVFAAKEFPGIRIELLGKIEALGSVRAPLLWMLSFYDNKQYQEAYTIIPEINIGNLEVPHCNMIRDIVRNVGDYNRELEILERVLSIETDKIALLNYEAAQFAAYMKLGKYDDAIRVGKKLIGEDALVSIIGERGRESLLSKIIEAYTNRNQFTDAADFIENYTEILQSFDILCYQIAELYFQINDTQRAIDSIVKGVKQLQNPTDEQYGSLFFSLTKIPEEAGYSINASDDAVTDESFVKLVGEDKWYHIGDVNALDAHPVGRDDDRFEVLLGRENNDLIQFSRDKYANKKDRQIELILPIDKYIFWRARSCFFAMADSGHSAVSVIHMPEVEGKPDLGNLTQFMSDLDSKKQSFDELYKNNSYPVALLAIQEGGLLNAIGKISHGNHGFIRLSEGTLQETQQQIENAKKIISGDDFYLDAISALFLAETGYLEKIHANLPNLKTPQSVFNSLFEAVKFFQGAHGSRGRMGYVDGKIVINEINEGQTKHICYRIQKTIEILEADKSSIESVSSSPNQGALADIQVPPVLRDACVLAQQHGAIVLTDDYLYLHAESIGTKNRIPDYCSTYMLMRVLYENKVLSFEDYANYFSYLASYRCRFLSLNAEDLWRVTLGDGKLTVFQPESIRKLHLYLTLSEEYGVSLDSALRVLCVFMVKVIIDDAISVEATNRIFTEILPPFLEGRRITDKRNAAVLILSICKKQTEMWIAQSIMTVPPALANAKLAALDAQLALFCPSSRIFIPNYSL